MSAARAVAIRLLGLCCTCEMAGSGCDGGGLPSDPPPGACQAGDRVCYHEPVSGRDYLLRCNIDEIDGAIWLIDEVCLDGASCEIDRCVPPGGAP